MDAKEAKKAIWLDVEVAMGEMITINRRALSWALEEVEKIQYEKGYSDGWEHRGIIQNDGVVCNQTEW